MRRFSVIIFILSTAFSVAGQEKDSRGLMSPLKELPSLSASFAELRNGHFHSGLDYKTGGVTGKEVLAADDGYVYRISVTPSGFGKALYIRHASGISTIYGHLESFRPDIEEYVRKKQYEMKRFSVSLYPGRNEFVVKRGEVIALSGNTGGSSGPHLHFEVRDSGTEDPLNPLEYGIKVSDRVRPVIEKIVLYPLEPGSAVNGTHDDIALKTVFSGNRYRVTDQVTPVITGPVGVGIKCWDTFDNTYNRCGVYSIELFVDSIKMYSFSADRFSYAESRYLNGHIDYKASVLRNEYIHRLYIQPGDRLSMYGPAVNRGIIEFPGQGTHRADIVVADQAGNRSTATFYFRSSDPGSAGVQTRQYSKIIPYNRASEFTSDGIRVHFPEGCLYDTLFLEYSVRPSGGKYLSPIHSLHNKTVAVNDPIRISVRPDTVIPGREDKMCLAVLNGNNTIAYTGGDLRYGFVSADVSRLGDYVVTIDTIPPEIVSSFQKGTDLSGRKLFTFKITDNFSGIASYNLRVDGNWVLAEYDPKNDLLIVRPQEPYLKKGMLHKAELQITDNRGNSRVLRTEFRW